MLIFMMRSSFCNIRVYDYDHLSYESEVTVLAGESELVASLVEGQRGTVFVKETPFYATMGGQEGDTRCD